MPGKRTAPWTRVPEAAWHKLLLAEKERRGLSGEQLVFLGIHNLAQYWWCAQYAVLKSRANECAFFKSYLIDRLSYSLRMGIAEIPRRRVEWLEVGDDLTHDHAETLLASVASEDELPDDRSPSADPMNRGLEDEYAFAERYPRLRWNWPWKEYVLIGAPDGITDEFVYEFKSTEKAFWLRFSRSVALAQADLYGHFWERSEKRVQILVNDTGKVSTYVGAVDSERALQTLRRFERVDHGEPPRRPAPLKCSSCGFRDTCPLLA